MKNNMTQTFQCPSGQVVTVRFGYANLAEEPRYRDLIQQVRQITDAVEVQTLLWEATQSETQYAEIQEMTFLAEEYMARAFTVKGADLLHLSTHCFDYPVLSHTKEDVVKILTDYTYE